MPVALPPSLPWSLPRQWLLQWLLHWLLQWLLQWLLHWQWQQGPHRKCCLLPAALLLPYLTSKGTFALALLVFLLPARKFTLGHKQGNIFSSLASCCFICTFAFVLIFIRIKTNWTCACCSDLYCCICCYYCNHKNELNSKC